MGLRRISSESQSNHSKYVSDTEPTDYSEGDEWVDTSFRKPAKKIWIDGGWAVLSEGSNIPRSTPVALVDGDEFDVSGIEKIIEFKLWGNNGGNADWGGNGYEGGDGGNGAFFRGTIDLTHFETLKIAYVSGEDGEVEDNGRYPDTHAGDGGTGIILLDSNGNKLAAASGGGGGGTEDGTTLRGGTGGGPSGGSGGISTIDYQKDGENGHADNLSNHVQTLSTSTSNTIGCELFTGD